MRAFDPVGAIPDQATNVSKLTNLTAPEDQ